MAAGLPCFRDSGTTAAPPTGVAAFADPRREISPLQYLLLTAVFDLACFPWNNPSVDIPFPLKRNGAKSGAVPGAWLIRSRAPRRAEVYPGIVATVSPSEWASLIDEIERLEGECFEPGLRESRDDLLAMATPSALLIVAGNLGIEPPKPEGGLRDWSLAMTGYLAGDRMELYSQGDYDGLPGLATDGHRGLFDTYYFASRCVQPVSRGKGIGGRLRDEAYAVLRRNGFRRVTSHTDVRYVRSNEGWRVISTHPDWYGTGRMFAYCERALVA